MKKYEICMYGILSARYDELDLEKSLQEIRLVEEISIRSFSLYFFYVMEKNITKKI